MSRYDGWLARYIMFKGTPTALTLKDAAKGACIRPEAFADALRDPKLVRADAKHLGLDPDELRETRLWRIWLRADEDFAQSMVDSAKAVAKKAVESDKYRGSGTRLGVTRPHPTWTPRRDDLNLPINPLPHPEPKGEWHSGLDAAGGR